MTNSEKIKNMNEEELREYLKDKPKEHFKNLDTIMAWLNSEAEDDDDINTLIGEGFEI